MGIFCFCYFVNTVPRHWHIHSYSKKLTWHVFYFIFFIMTFWGALTPLFVQWQPQLDRKKWEEDRGCHADRLELNQGHWSADSVIVHGEHTAPGELPVHTDLPYILRLLTVWKTRGAPQQCSGSHCCLTARTFPIQTPQLGPFCGDFSRVCLGYLWVLWDPKLIGDSEQSLVVCLYVSALWWTGNLPNVSGYRLQPHTTLMRISSCSWMDQLEAGKSISPLIKKVQLQKECVPLSI